MSGCFLCGAEGEECGHCGEVFHCGDHRKVHRPTNLCFPFRVSDSPSAGRIVVATRHIPALTPVLHDAALAAGPKLRSSLVCVECFAEMDSNRLVTCTKCGLPFCSVRCQKLGRLHVAECGYIARAERKVEVEELSAPGGVVLEAVTVLRLLHNGKAVRLLRLVDHIEDIKATDDWQIFTSVAAFIRERCSVEEFSEADILHALGVLSSNACNMAGFRARALFPIYSLINHSCAANARNIVSSEEGTVEVLAQKDIRKGEEVTIRYTTNLLEGTRARRATLASQWNFSCCCSRCSDNSPEGSLAGLVCFSCKKGVVLPSDPLDPCSPWTCSCSATITAEEAETRVDKVQSTLDKVPRTDVARLESFLKAATSVLHPRHALVLAITRTLFSLYGGSIPGYTQAELSEDQVARKLELGERYLVAMERVDPGLTKWRGQMLYEMNKYKLVRSLQALQQRKIGVDQFVQQVAASVGEVEEAVAGMVGQPLHRSTGLRSRLGALTKEEVLGAGYSQILRIITSLPFIQ